MDTAADLTATTAELKAQRRRLKTLQRQREAKLIERHNDLLESIGYGFGSNEWAYNYYGMLDRFNQYSNNFIGVTTLNDRRYGRDYPIYMTEIDLQMLRMPSRLLCATNPYCIGILEGWISYIVGDGFTKVVQAKPGKEKLVPPCILSKLQTVIDDFAERNQWDGEELPGLEEELIWRREEDGEFVLCLHADDDGYGWVTTIEPEQLSAPPDAAMDYMFGVYTPSGSQIPESYYIRPIDDLSGKYGDDYDAEQIVHSKKNVKRQMKRGIPTFSFGTADTLDLADKLRQALGSGAAAQAKISIIRQWEGVTQQQVTSFQETFATYTQQTDPTCLGQNVPTRVYPNGAELDIPKGMQYVAPPSAVNGAAHEQILQACIRGAAARFNAPEFWSSDASNNNFSSAVVAGSLFDRRAIREQRSPAATFHRIFWWALDTRCKVVGEITATDDDGQVHTIRWDELKKMVEVKVTPASVETRNKKEEADTAIELVQAKLRSREQAIGDIGGDVEETVEQIKAEAADDAEQAKLLQPQMPGAAGAMGGQPGAEQPQADGGGEETAAEPETPPETGISESRRNDHGDGSGVGGWIEVPSTLLRGVM